MLNLFALVAFTGTSASTGTRDALVISAPQLDGHRPPFVKKRERCSAMEGGVALWSHARYRIMRDVGEGSYGRVYKAEDLQRPGHFVAVKVSRKVNQEKGMPDSVLREISILRRLNHSSIIRLIDVVEGLGLILEYVERDLHQFMRHNPKLLDEALIKDLTLQLLRGVQHCHERSVIHRDLKPSNIMIDECYKLKLVDFGMGREFTLPVTPMSPVVVTQYYRAPELFWNQQGLRKYGPAVDVWSVGTIFAEMWTRRPVFGKRGEREQIDEMARAFGLSGRLDFSRLSNAAIDINVNLVPQLHDPAGRHLLCELLRFRPEKRITARGACTHPYFTLGKTVSNSDNIDRC